MKKIITLLFVFPLWGLGALYAQKELWGVITGAEYTLGYYGNMTKYDINGENPVIMHEFDSIHGYRPKGRLFLASNGKLYGTTLDGGNVDPLNSIYTAGLLFEYDLTLNKYRVVHYFDRNDNPAIANPEIGVIEATPGILVGATQNRIYKYDMSTESITFSNALTYNNNIHSELMKASNGYIYGTSYYGPCQTTSSPEPFLGSIIQYNMTTNNLSFAHSISCGQFTLKGAYPNSELIEISPGKFMGVNRTGGLYFDFSNPSLGGGTLFEFDINTNAFTKKIDFDYANKGIKPSNLINGGNGKLYGLCEEGGAQNSCSLIGQYGTLYEYDPVINTFEIKQYINDCISNDFTIRYPQFLMKTSLGHFIGGDLNGNMFKYVLNTNTITRPSFGYKVANLIEICRKPSYQEFNVDTFDGCVGSTFTYDIQNANATSYQWLKNNVNVTGQTTGILNLTNLTASDAGAYTCLMTNECGTTTTMVLHLNLNCLGVNPVASLEKAIKLYPNPTINSLNIKLPENIEVNVNRVTIANSLGQIVLETKAENTTTIDVNLLQSGIYFINLITNYGDWKGKFVKE